MKRNRHVKELAAIPLFRGCSTAELAVVGRNSMLVDLPGGKDLTVEGRRGHEFFVIVEGHAEVLRAGHLVANLGPGDFAGELSLLTDIPRTATVRSTTPVKLLLFSTREFHSVLRAAPTLAKRLLEGLAERLVIEELAA